MDAKMKELKEKLDYKGCRNCEHQIEPLRMCVWAETNPQTMIMYICPNWAKRGETDERYKYLQT